jgi:hypothetical protein
MDISMDNIRRDLFKTLQINYKFLVIYLNNQHWIHFNHYSKIIRIPII